MSPTPFRHIRIGLNEQVYDKTLVMSSGELIVVSKGEKYEVEWKLDFDSLPSFRLIWSPEFSFEGENWDLNMKPEGKKNECKLNLGLCRLTKHVDSEMDIEFSFALKTVKGQRYAERSQSGVFGVRTIDQCHYIERCVYRTDVLQNKSELCISGSIIVLCTLKRLTSAEMEDNTETAECVYCKKSFAAENLSSHKKKCRVKCPECSNFVVYRCWHDHICQVSSPKAATNANESSVSSNHTKILQDLKQLTLNQEYSDVIFRVKGREFPAHKAILAVRSPVFASTFRHEMKEKKTGVVDIEDCDPSVFSDFLCFLYSGDIDNLSGENVFGLFTIADKYDCPDLRVKCIDFIKENLSVEIFCKALTLALQYNEAELLQMATDFFIKNAEKIIVTVDWQTFTIENPVQSNELVVKLVASSRFLKS